MAKSTINWRKRILLPFWIVRICLTMIVVIGFSVAIAINRDRLDRQIRFRVAIAFLACTVLVLLLDVVQIILWARDRLHPTYFAGLTIFQAIFWCLVMILDIIAIAHRQQSPRAVGMVVILFLLYLGLFIYSIRGYFKQRRQTKRGHYEPARNPKTPAAAMELPYATYGQSAEPYRSAPDAEHHEQSEPLYPASGETAYRSGMLGGGDLGQAEPLYSTSYGAPPGYYSDRPTMPRSVV